ncbi:aminotransferase class IV [Streptomyces sp. 4N509B]|uniref:aminotransferase class IV n=1 Tax=Streptomyces sp. 4N509B TaxID=3457413 RepID=UPI003FD3D8C1
MALALLDGAPAGSGDLRALALTNYGHFTTMRVDDGRVRGLSLHLERLVRDCRTVFGAELAPDRVRNLLARAAREVTGSFVARVTVFDPAIDVGDPAATATPHVLVTTRPAGGAGSADEPPLRVRTCAFRRELPAVKHVGLFGALHLRRSARLDGYDDALFTDPTGLVSEGCTWNVGFVHGDDEAVVTWPRADALPGVTMALLQRLHPYTVTPVTRELHGVRAAFATNAAIGVRPISAIDDRRLTTDHPLLAALRAAYASLPGEPLE